MRDDSFILVMSISAAALLATAIGCVEIPIEKKGQQVRSDKGRPSRGERTPTATCDAEPSNPAAIGKMVVDGDPQRATSIRVEAENTTGEEIFVAARLRTYAGGQERTIESEPVSVRPGAVAGIDLALAELRISPASSPVPVRIMGSLVVQAADGGSLGRVTLAPVDVGPQLDEAVRAVLRSQRLKKADLDLRELGARIVAIDSGSAGLFADELDDPDDDGGHPTPEPNYSSAKPDDNGMFHYDFCLRWPISLDDAGFGEDYGIEPEGAWKARGGRVKLVRYGETLFDGYLDFNGCTGTIDTPYHGDFMFIAYSRAEILGNEIIALDEDDDTQAWLRLVPEAGGSGTKYYTLPYGETSNLVAVPTFTVARFGTISGETLRVHDRCNTGGSGCCNCADGEDLYIDDSRLKFVIAHEVGHSIMFFHTGDFVNGCTQLQVPSNFPCFNSSSHAIDSVEMQSCAATEGWAHFVAVRAFNDHLEGDNPGAILQYWRDSGLTVDVEQGPVGGVDKYHETVCGGTQANAGGMGVELDWLRAFWDYHTNPEPGYRPDTSVMIDEIEQAGAWVFDDTYFVIRDGIESSSGDEQRTRWVQQAQWNGIDR